ncbi:MAG TPA: glycosyltransferase family 4 protein [Candidatus Methylomirabilis sp.]|nr:glycosyltransferase family 4 protein [Candidatus Methylomirabilis sp.]
MRILWVKVGGLWPLNTGGRLRSFHILSELSRHHPVTLLTTHGPDDDPEELPRRLPHCRGVRSMPATLPKRGSARFVGALLRSWLSSLPLDINKCRVPDLRRTAQRIIRAGECDVCVADFLAAVPNVPLEGAVPVVLFSHNVEHLIWRRLSRIEGRGWRRALLELEWRKMRRFEAQACSRVNLTIAVSEDDRRLLAANAPRALVHALPTGVDSSYFTPNGYQENATGLVFTGSMDWYPNEDAILHFIHTILPGIQREVPEVSMTVVGRNPRPSLRQAATAAGIRVTGTVQDVRPYVAEAAVYVVPLRAGGGTRLKIFEALAMGKAVVSTTVGAEGLPLVSGEHFVRADDPAEFARAVVSLLRDPARRRALGMAGRHLVEQRYSWAQVAREFETHLEGVRRANNHGDRPTIHDAARPAPRLDAGADSFPGW